MEPKVSATISTLLEMRGTVRSEMERLGKGQPPDRQAFERLRDMVHHWAEQADTQILAMVGQGAPEPLVGVMEEIFDAFRDAERQLEVVIRRGCR
jgi:hypothetical protein